MAVWEALGFPQEGQAGLLLLARVLRAASLAASPPRSPGQVSLHSGRALTSRHPSPSLAQQDGNWEQTLELTLEIPKGGQDNTEACSKVGGPGSHGAVQGGEAAGREHLP